MRGIVRIFNVIVALCVIVLLLLIFWFLFAKYVRGGSASATISYIRSTLGVWFRSFPEMIKSAWNAFIRGATGMLDGV